MTHAVPCSRRRLATVLLAGAAILLTGCATSAQSDTGPGAPTAAAGQVEHGATPQARLAGDLTVFAAASLTGTFTELADEFHTQHPDVTVRPVFDGSSTLLAQLTEGAAADVFASADAETMHRAVVAGVIDGTPELFARNTLMIAVAPGNPHHIHGLGDLAAPGLVVVLCAPEVPCGAASATVLADAHVRVTPVSQEQNVKAVLTKVALGEADAGLVYTTDVRASVGEVEGVPIADATMAVNGYLIGVPAASGNKTAARAFIDLVESTAGQKVLAAAGFEPR